MPRKHSKTKRKTRRGGSLRDWAQKTHQYIRSKNGYSKGLSFLHNRYGKPMIESRLGNAKAAIVNQGIKFGLTKLRQSGYGLRRSGNGLRRSGMGKRLKY